MSIASIKEGKRELIVRAAIQIFSQKGYHKARMEEIAVAAGIGKGTIYEYFASKLQLLQEILDQSFHLYHDCLQADISQSSSFEDKIRLLLEGHFRFCQENKDLTRLLFWDAEVIDEELKEWAMETRREKEKRLHDMISAAISSGEIRDFDPQYLTVIIGGVFGAIWAPVVVDGWQVDAAEAARHITDLIMGGLRP